MSLVRVRQHVNPLSQKYQSPVSPPDWERVYADCTRPLHLDIGCGRGQFLLTLAQQQPTWNYLGLEIRQPLVVQANERREEFGLTNLHYLFCNVSTSLRSILASLPQGSLQRVTIQFPDPWFKRRHQKRRMVQPELVQALSTYLVEDGVVFLQSDIEAVAKAMHDRFSEHPSFTSQHSNWLETNPLSVATEREQWVLEKGEPVYRSIFIRKVTR